MAILQLALDFVDAERAEKVADEAVRGGVDWLEVGTPLIKSEGIGIIRRFKRKYPNKKIVADMKIMDTGSLEAEMAAKAGADVIIILGVADNSTIREAVKAAHRYGSKVAADLINSPDMLKRARELDGIGLDYICVHIGIDQQMRGMDPLVELKRLAGQVKTPLAIAGGVGAATAAEAAKYAAVVVVGGAITKAEDAEKATKAIKKAMETGKAGKQEKGAPEGIAEIFKKVSTPNISDAMQHRNEIFGLRSITGLKLFGPAVTVRAYNGDWAKPVQAIELVKKGEVIIIDAGGGLNACWGELASLSCRNKGVAGVVIDGAVRDVEEIKKIGLPVFARSTSSSSGDPKGWGEINCEIKCGGAAVRPGDWVVGDESGIVIIPAEEANEIAGRAMDTLERENRIREEIRRGETLSEVLYLKKWEKVG